MLILSLCLISRSRRTFIWFAFTLHSISLLSAVGSQHLTKYIGAVTCHKYFSHNKCIGNMSNTSLCLNNTDSDLGHITRRLDTVVLSHLFWLCFCLVFLSLTCMCPPSKLYILLVSCHVAFFSKLTHSRCHLTTASESRLRHCRWVVWHQRPAQPPHPPIFLLSPLSWLVLRVSHVCLSWELENGCHGDNETVLACLIREEEVVVLPKY